MKKLSLIEIALFLKNIFIFEDLDLDLLIAISDKMNQDIYDENEVVFEEGQKAIQMYFIVKGSVHILNKNNTILKTLIHEDFFGDEALFNNLPRSYKVKCVSETLILTLNKLDLITIMSECPTIGIFLLNLYSKSLECRFLNQSRSS